MNKKRTFNTLALALMLALSIALGDSASATHITPIVIAGNPSCTSLGYDYGFKPFPEPPPTGTYSDGVLTVTISSNPTYFSWTSNIGVDAVIVKGGSNANLYAYDPPQEEFSDDGLHSPISSNTNQPYDISHIEFCYDIELEVSKTAAGTYDRTHTWDIEKSVSPTSQSGFADDILNWTWTVDLSETYTDSNFAVNGTITIHNPALVPVTFSIEDQLDDDTTANVNCPSYTVAAGGTLECTYTASPEDASATLNTVTVTSQTQGVGGDTASEPVGWTATVYNGTAVVDDNQESDFPTTVNAGEGPWEWTEAQSHTCSTTRSDYGEDGSYSDTRYNTATVTGSDGQTDSSDANTTYTCETSYVDVLKLTNGVEHQTMEWAFELRQNGSTLESLSTPPTLLEFQTTLVPGDEYTLCETNIPPSWTIQWALDGNGNGVIDDGETLPFAGGEADLIDPGLLQVYDPDPLYGQDGAVNDTRCVNFLADEEAGDTIHFIIDNQRPGGEPRTPGYWKNWNTCTNGNQPQTAEKNGGPSEGWFLLDDLLLTSAGDLVIDNCEDGVNVLDQRELTERNRKKANDAAYTLAMHLLAAKLNLAAGAETCPEVVDAVAAGDALLSSIDFDGTGNYLSPKDAEYQTALDLAATLDAYNNGELCEGGSAPSIPNGGFELGNFTAWNQAGNNNGDLADAQVLSSLGLINPTEGSYMALVQGATNVDFNFLYTDTFDWTAFSQVCFDIKVLFNGSLGLSDIQPFAAVAKEPTAGQPILASIVIDGISNDYDTFNFISNITVQDRPVQDGTGTGFNWMTAWETFCFDPSGISFDGGNPITSLSFFLTFGWSGSGFTDQAYLIDNVQGVP